MSSIQGTPEILTRLGYDGSDLKKGFSQARQDYANYKAQAVLIETELKREKVRLATEFSAEGRRQIQQHIDDLRRELAAATGAIANKRGAERQAAQQRATELRQEFGEAQKQIAGYELQKQKVVELGNAQAAAVAKARQAQAAAGVFRETGRATGEIPGLSDLVSNLAPGLTNIQSRLGGILNSLVMLGGGVKGGTDALGASAGLASSKVLLLAGGITGAAAAGIYFGKKLADTAIEAGKFAQEIDHVSQKLGISTKDLQVFQAIGSTVGLTLNDMVVAQRQFSAALTGSAALGPGGEMIEGSKKGTEILKALGIETRNASGGIRDTKDLLIELSAAFSQMPNGAEKSRIAIELFGRSGLNLIPFLNLGPKKLKELQDVFGELAPDLTKTGRLYDDLEVAQAKWNLSMTALKNNIAEGLLPAITAFVETLNALTRIELQGGSLLAYLLTGKLTIPQQVGAQMKAMGFEKIPTVGAQDMFERLKKTVETGHPERLHLENLLMPGSSNEIIARNKNDIDLITQARAELAKRRPGIVASPEDIAAQAVVIAGLTQVKKSEVEINDTLKDRMLHIREILASGKQESGDRKADSEQRKKDLAEIADLESKIAAKMKEQEPSANRVAQSESGRLAEINAVLLPRLRAAQTGQSRTVFSEDSQAVETVTRSALHGEDLKRNLEEQNDLLKERDKLEGQILKKQTEQKKLSEDQRREQQLQNILASQIPSQSVAAQGAIVLPEEVSNLIDLSSKSQLIKAPLPPSQLKEFFGGLKEFGNVVGKFDSGLNKNLVQMFALVEGFQVVIKQMETLSGKTAEQGGFLAGLKTIFTGKNANGTEVGAGARISGALGVAGAFGGGIASLRNAFNQGGLSGILSGVGAGAAMGSALLPGIGTVVGAVAGGIVGIFGAIFGGAKRRTAELAKQVMSDFSEALKNIDAQLKGLPYQAVPAATTGGGLLGAFRRAMAKRSDLLAPPTTGVFTPPPLTGQIDIVQKGLQDELANRASAVAKLQGRKGGMDQLNKLLPEMDKQISALNDQLNQLKQTQQQVFDNFSKNLDFMKVATGAQSAAQAISQIATTLREAADAGASAGDQIDYLNRSVNQLTASLGRDLRSAEQNAVDLMLQQIDLQRQRQDIIDQADQQEAQIRASLGITRVQTPGQAAAAQIRAIEEQKAKQLKSLDEQALQIDAQIGAQKELFGLTSDRNVLLATQLDIQKQITAETVAQIQSQIDFYRQLASGQIPDLPGSMEDFLRNFSLTPSAPIYNIGSATIEVTLTGTPVTPETAAQALSDGLARLASGQSRGAV